MKISGITLSNTNLLRLFNLFDAKAVDIQGNETQTFLFESALVEANMEIDIQFEVSMKRDYDADKITKLDYVDASITAFVDSEEVDCSFDADACEEYKDSLERQVRAWYFDEK